MIELIPFFCLAAIGIAVLVLIAKLRRHGGLAHAARSARILACLPDPDELRPPSKLTQSTPASRATLAAFDADVAEHYAEEAIERLQGEDALERLWDAKLDAGMEPEAQCQDGENAQAEFEAASEFDFDAWRECCNAPRTAKDVLAQLMAEEEADFAAYARNVARVCRKAAEGRLI